MIAIEITAVLSCFFLWRISRSLRAFVQVAATLTDVMHCKVEISRRGTPIRDRLAGEGYSPDGEEVLDGRRSRQRQPAPPKGGSSAKGGS